VLPLLTTIAQASSSSGAGSAARGLSLIEKAKQGGWYPLLVIGGVVVLAAVFALLVKMRRDMS
jgi:hypothetical protein